MNSISVKPDYTNRIIWNYEPETNCPSHYPLNELTTTRSSRLESSSLLNRNLSPTLHSVNQLAPTSSSLLTQTCSPLTLSDSLINHSFFPKTTLAQSNALVLSNEGSSSKVGLGTSQDAKTPSFLIHHTCPKLNYSFVVSNLATTRLKFSQDELGSSSGYAGPVSLNNESENVRVPPTQRFYEAHRERHDYLASYDVIVNRALIVEREREHLQTHIPLYTAFKKEILLLQVFNSSLLTRANKKQREHISGRTWFRDPFGNPPGNIRFQKIKDYLKLQNRSGFFGRDVALDNKGATSWHLISCNPHLYGNTLHASEESTLDYFYDNSNVSPPDIREIFHKTIKNSGLDKLNREETEVFFLRLKSCLDLLHSPHGIMQQIFIPHSEVNNLVYISKANGIQDPEHPDPLEALLGLQKKIGGQIPNEKSMQVRLLASRFLDLNLEIDYITYTYSAMPPNRIDEFQRAVNLVVKDLIDANVQRSTSR